MKINKSGAKFSAIVQIGQDLREQSKMTDNEYLFLNRGINQVENIDLSELIPFIDFNSDSIQHYPHSKGLLSLRKAINNEFFGGKTNKENIFITGGGMHALYLVFQSLGIKKVFSHSFYWGAYANVLKIAEKEHLFYRIALLWLLHILCQTLSCRLRTELAPS